MLSAQIACELNKLGINKGDRLVAIVSKSVEALALYLACLRSGVIFVPLNPAFTLNELEYFLENAETKIIVCNQNAIDEIRAIASQIGIKIVKTIDAADPNNLLAPLKNQSQAPEFLDVNVASDDPAVMIYTSGTTGKPKGAMLSHQNLAVNGMDLKNHWDFQEQDVLLHCLPIFHVHGLFFATHCVMLSGASMLFLSKFSVEIVLKFLRGA
ncbi:MAG: AMP-binding protein, partial [Waterburya sp.]